MSNPSSTAVRPDAGSVTLFTPANPLVMECGVRLAPIAVSYETCGKLNASADNGVLVCHALTGSAHAAGFVDEDPKHAGWWDGFIGPNRGIDTSKYFVVSSNFLGGCYGTTGSISENPETRRPYGLAFPQMTVRDMVQVQHALLQHLGVQRLVTVAGGSLGGMQVLEWAIMYPEMVASIVPIATASQHSPWCIGLNEIARQAITNDPGWRDGDYYGHEGPVKGLALARQVAMMSYRSDVSFLHRFGRERQRHNGASNAWPFDAGNLFQVESYLRYQGKKLIDRFDANTYLYITRAMDLHDVASGRGTQNEVLGSIRIPVLSIGISSDILYPVREQKSIANAIPGSEYVELDSPFGHDAFLIEIDQLNSSVRSFLASHSL